MATAAAPAEPKYRTGTIAAVELLPECADDGYKFSESDLQELVSNHAKFCTGPDALHRVPVVLGHEDDQAWLTRTDLPAAGWLEGPVSLNSEGVIQGDLTGVPEPILEMVEAGFYRKLSPEVYTLKDNQGNALGRVFRRIGLLGAEVPKNKGLADLRRRVAALPHVQMAEAGADVRRATMPLNLAERGGEFARGGGRVSGRGKKTPATGTGKEEEKYQVGDQLTYTGKAGSHPAEFRGYHPHPGTGEKMARVIVRPPGGPPFETSVKPAELSRGAPAGAPPPPKEGPAAPAAAAAPAKEQPAARTDGTLDDARHYVRSVAARNKDLGPHASIGLIKGELEKYQRPNDETYYDFAKRHMSDEDIGREWRDAVKFSEGGTPVATDTGKKNGSPLQAAVAKMLKDAGLSQPTIDLMAGNEELMAAVLADLTGQAPADPNKPADPNAPPATAGAAMSEEAVRAFSEKAAALEKSFGDRAAALEKQAREIQARQDAVDAKTKQAETEQDRKAVYLFAEGLVREKRLAPAELDETDPRTLSLPQRLLAMDNAAVVHKFSENGKDVALTARQLEMERLRKQPVSHRFSEKAAAAKDPGVNKDLDDLAARTKAYVERTTKRPAAAKS